MGRLQLAGCGSGAQRSPGPLLSAGNGDEKWHLPSPWQWAAVPAGGTAGLPPTSPRLSLPLSFIRPRLLPELLIHLLRIFIPRLANTHTKRSVPDLRSKNSDY